MRRDQADKADRSAQGYAHADQDRYGDHDPQRDGAHIDADAAGVILPDSKCVELTRAQQEPGGAGDQGA
ncbi:hypothetical protein SDC9_177725 [bioreactor metagenome]|uniref:Uncharacterized protein n=1 Tax=bioreactor metagenome TaxID=1076179 RepID=A0A645GW47_9ZZZZ